MSYVLLFALCALRSVPVPVREVSRGEWWSVRTPTVAATATVTRGWNPPSQRVATRGPALCGTTAFGERWDVITLHHLTYPLWFLTAFPIDSFFSAFWSLRTTLLPVTLTKVRLFAHKHVSQTSLFTLQQLHLGMWPFHKTSGMPSRWKKCSLCPLLMQTWKEWGSDGGSSKEWTIADLINNQLPLI